MVLCFTLAFNVMGVVEREERQAFKQILTCYSTHDSHYTSELNQLVRVQIYLE